MTTDIDIYSMERIHGRYLSRLEILGLSPMSQSLLRDFDLYNLRQGLGLPRRCKYLQHLTRLARWLGKSFEAATREDLERIVRLVDEHPTYSVWTRHDYKTALKKFYQWLLQERRVWAGDVTWIRTAVRQREIPRVHKTALPSPREIETILQVADNLRDRALVAVLAESGARIGELLTMRIGDVYAEAEGLLLNLTGKTGNRKVLIIASTVHLVNFLNVHPHRDDPAAPLWINLSNRHARLPMKYSTVRCILKRLASRAGIRKSLRPHLFRHARATALSSALTEFEMNHFFGWVQGSDMPATYIHLDGSTVRQKLLALHGRATPLDQQRPIQLEEQSQKCQRCQFDAAKQDKYYARCGLPLDASNGAALSAKTTSLLQLLELLPARSGRLPPQPTNRLRRRSVPQNLRLR